jgi:hypothetical protein
MSIFSVAFRHSGGVFSPGMVSLTLTQTTKPLDVSARQEDKRNTLALARSQKVPADELRWTAGGQ